MRMRAADRCTRLVLIAACAIAAAVQAMPARAEERGRELIPELNAYIKLSERTRAYLLADVTRTQSDGSRETELGAHLDFTLMPILRRELRDANWARDRYLWVRAGYVRLGNPDDEDTGPTERRVLLEATARVELPGEVWLVNRARVDLRDIGGEHSQRYRVRPWIEREYKVGGIVLVPYAQAEFLYDTRFDVWNRQIYQVGVEVELNKHWRIEPYVARQNDSRSPSGNVDRAGLVLKFYM
jgi:hypothetical protein